MIHPALRLLFRLQSRAAFRRVTRKMRTGKGAFFVIVGVLVFLTWLGPVLFSLKIAHRTNPETVRQFAPLLLLLMCILTLFTGGDRSISFTPGEINFLFPGPFTRRQLLIYKLARTLLGVLFSGFILSIALLQHAPSWPAAFVGGVLAMGLVQLLTLVVSMLTQTIGTRLRTLSRRIVLIGIVAIIAASSGRKLFQDGWKPGLVKLNESPAAKIARMPAMPFVYTFTAQSFSELLRWGAAALAIDAGLLVLLFRLDTDYREASLAASQRLFERLERMRRGQIVTNLGQSGVRRRRLPMFPWLGGTGPTVWRQFTTAVRTARGALLFLLAMSGGIVPVIVVSKANIAVIAMMTGWMTVMISMFLKFDFRSDLEQMDWMKALPLSPTATAAGQLLTPAFVFTIVQTIVLSTGAYVATPHQRLMLLAALPFLFPLNLLMTAIDNLLFLLYPSRAVGASPGDIGFMGRTIFFLILKMISVATIGGLTFGLGALAYFLSGRSMLIGGIVAFSVICTIAIAMVPCVGLAFKKFDPSFDTPA